MMFTLQNEKQVLEKQRPSSEKSLDDKVGVPKAFHAQASLVWGFPEVGAPPKP